ncbi:MAG: hypothetical protein AAGH81_18395, partial [Bacteroidota bacterium]
RSLTYLFWLSFCVGWSQQESPLDNLVIESFGYPDFGDNSIYGEFEALYPLGNETSVGLQGLNQQNAAFRRLNARLTVEQRLARMLLGVVGYGAEWDLTNPDWKRDASTSFYLGMEYEPKPNLSINAGIRSFLNQPGFNPLGTEKGNANAQWSIGSKLKF